MPRIPQPVSRTSSITSTESLSDDSNSTTSSTLIRRSRKRFTNHQLMLLESLFHQTSHPSREERETVAAKGGMETKSVTIWFQNKRQLERRSALQRTEVTGLSVTPTTMTTTTTTTTTTIINPSAEANPNRVSEIKRPSLDYFASLSERHHRVPRTPPPHPSSSSRSSPGSNLALYDHMPSSPIAPSNSPLAREYVEFGKLKKSMTLEWACARQRLKRNGQEEDSDDGTDEAVTPPPPRTATSGDVKWTMTAGGRMTVLHNGVQDDEMLRAALALCGLGRDL